jgi:hypothetical protein
MVVCGERRNDSVEGYEMVVEIQGTVLWREEEWLCNDWEWLRAVSTDGCVESRNSCVGRRNGCVMIGNGCAQLARTVV